MNEKGKKEIRSDLMYSTARTASESVVIADMKKPDALISLLASIRILIRHIPYKFKDGSLESVGIAYAPQNDIGPALLLRPYDDFSQP